MQTAPVTSRISLSNILLTTDFSEASKAAASYATALARWYGGKIFVAHVFPPEPYLTLPLEPQPMVTDFLWNRARTALAEFLPAAAIGNTPHEEILRRGELWSVISDVIHQRNIDLVVIGTHGRHGLKKMVLGSATEKIYRQAACPVLTVGPDVNRKSAIRDWEPKQIVFPTDFSEASLHAFRYALSLAEETKATLILAHMIPLVPWQYKDTVEASTRQRLASLVPKDAFCRFDHLVGFDFPGAAILRLAHDREADLIVMGVRKKGAPAWSAHSPWSTASEVVNAAPCPVLTVRA